MIGALAIGITMAAGPLSSTPVIVDIQGKTVAILPFVYRGGTRTAMRTVRDTVGRFFDRAGYGRTATHDLRDAWHHAEMIGPESDPLPPMPSDSELRHIGHDLNVDAVCAGEVTWHTRSIWVALGPKTKSTCSINMKIMNLDNGNDVLDVHDVWADDTEEESGFATAAGILTGGLVTVVSGGPETPHEQRAAQIALSKAFEPWLEGVIGR